MGLRAYGCNYSLARKTVNTRENFCNVYCFATNQMRDETAKDNRQIAAWISHDLTQNNELAFSSTRNLQFYRFQMVKFFFHDFGFGRIDMSKVLRKSDVKSGKKTGSVNQTQLDSASESEKK